MANIFAYYMQILLEHFTLQYVFINSFIKFILSYLKETMFYGMVNIKFFAKNEKFIWHIHFCKKIEKLITVYFIYNKNL